MNRTDLFHQKQFLLVGGADNKLHAYRLRLKEDSGSDVGQEKPKSKLLKKNLVLTATNSTKRLFGDDRDTVMFNAPVQAIYNSIKARSFIAASALG